ncbi:hypothetical protein K0M31_001980 [Melipona bicolor]|uniref:Uncharacterized protein n=1 Tax=Melipona bicolor TaxID=60889 RepID=A0AA40GGK8_9HYME|nr:hypothetical protein K0M31_001980 [Melipona bicolor]
MMVPKSERLPPLRWKLSRNAAPHQWEDGIARVLFVGAADGLCLLMSRDSSLRHPFVTINCNQQ